MAAAVGSAIGLGNIWRFPYEVGQYGGASFLVVYIACVLVLGYPLIVAELAFGRSIRGSFLTAYRNHGMVLCGFMSVFTIFCGVLVLSFYNVITGWTIGYFVELLGGSLLQAQDTNAFFNQFTASLTVNLLYGFIALCPVVWFIQQGVQAGIEKWSKILMPLFLILLVALIVYALMLPRAAEGLRFYISRITMEVVYKALAQSFLSLSVGLGIMITYGSYMKPQTAIPYSAGLIAGSDTITSFLAELFIFPFIHYKQIPVTHGSSLIFVSFPLVFQSLGPIVGKIVGSVFFILFAFAAITSSMSLLEVIVTYFVEKFLIKRYWAAYLSAILVYLVSILSMLSMGESRFLTNLLVYQGQIESLFGFISSFIVDILLPLSCLFFIMLFSYSAKREEFFLEIGNYAKGYKNSWLERYLVVTLRYVCPLLLAFIISMNMVAVIGSIRIN